MPTGAWPSRNFADPMKKAATPRAAKASLAPDIANEAAQSVGRCWWAGNDPLYIDYHDREWGFPVRDDRRLFEKLCLEGFQSGLSWRTILGRRDAFRAAFAGFDIARVSRYGSRDIERLVGDASIIRHRGKIESVRNNARRACELLREFGSLAAYFWRYEPPAKSLPARITRE